MVSITSGFWLIAVENSLANIFILLPLDIIWVIIQFTIWFCEVIYIQSEFVIEGFIMLHDRLYEIAIYIIIYNWAF